MMLIIGERINSTRQKIYEAVRSRNAAYILKEARSQLESGAAYIDINCAVTSTDELLDIDWIVSVVQSGIKDVNICFDSPNFLALEKALAVYKGNGGIFLNSITADEKRMESILPLAISYKTRLIALTMDEGGMPNTAEERFDIAKKIYNKVAGSGFNTEDLYFDALIRPVATEPDQAVQFLRSIPMIKNLGGVKTICGLSNVSYGLPKRGAVNAAFLAMAAQAGLDAAILDPTDPHISSALSASMAILGRDEYCCEYIKAFREGRVK